MTETATERQRQWRWWQRSAKDSNGNRIRIYIGRDGYSRRGSKDGGDKSRWSPKAVTVTEDGVQKTATLPEGEKRRRKLLRRQHGDFNVTTIEITKFFTWNLAETFWMEEFRIANGESTIELTTCPRSRRPGCVPSR